MIEVQYQANVDEITRANLLFIEKKPILKFLIKLVNFICSFLLILSLIKIMMGNALLTIQGLDYDDMAAIFFSILWLTSRRAINGYVIQKGLEDIDRMEVKIVAGENSITHKIGEKQINIPWRLINKYLKAKNGLIVIYNNNNFIWLPYTCFNTPNDIKNMTGLLESKKLTMVDCLDSVA